MELIKQEISVDKNIANETVQIMLEGEMVVPDSKADIGKIITSSAECFVESGEISGDRLGLNGTADISLIYLTKNKCVESMDHSCAINDFMVIEGLSADDISQLSCTVANVECCVINDRKAAYKVLLEIGCRVYSTYSGEVITGAEGLPEENISFNNVAYSDILSKQPLDFTIKEQLKIGRDKPNIENVTAVFAQPANISASCCRDGVNISGDLKINLLYNGQEGSNPLEAYNDEISFNGSLEVEGAEDNMICCPEVMVENLYYNIISDEDGEARVLDIECKLSVYPNVYGEKSIRIIEDAYCQDELLELEQKNIDAFKLICCNKSQCPIKQPIETDGADMLQIYCASGKAVIDNVSVQCDKTVVDGVLEVSVMYVTGNDNEPVCCFKGDIPFTHTLETRGSTEDMKAFVFAAPQHIGFNMLSQREVEIRGMIAVNCIITQNINFTAVTDIKEKPQPEGYLDNIPSLTVYIVKHGDTLWKLAKRFNTTVSNIAEINEIEDPDLIYPGERLMILKGIA